MDHALSTSFKYINEGGNIKRNRPCAVISVQAILEKHHYIDDINLPVIDHVSQRKQYENRLIVHVPNLDGLLLLKQPQHLNHATVLDIQGFGLVQQIDSVIPVDCTDHVKPKLTTRPQYDITKRHRDRHDHKTHDDHSSFHCHQHLHSYGYAFSFKHFLFAIFQHTINSGYDSGLHSYPCDDKSAHDSDNQHADYSFFGFVNFIYVRGYTFSTTTKLRPCSGNFGHYLRNSTDS
ncbi:hypothetical protein MPH_04003 [Macrophomina phaseolina MS6]|uniref:Uncharacterized protein n=1 Tax=Macrophomina phaseolina (strain MS6) TaxID=1126212 RepID=K2S1D0_MACPH|nr:hypothetical protein MPH_04003 [Macrophomina phaseolina MS6]